jgi:activator of 2-hydroxyglutaryl-CoA dehydratase
VQDILGGVHKAIATRTMSLVRRVGVEDEVTFTGGVSRNVGMVRALEAVLGRSINVSPDGHFIGAIGAALFAVERAEAAAGAAVAPDEEAGIAHVGPGREGGT